MRTLYQYETPSGSATVRLVHRDSGNPFAVIVDAPRLYATFQPFYDFELASAYYIESVEMVISAEPVRAMA